MDLCSAYKRHCPLPAPLYRPRGPSVPVPEVLGHPPAAVDRERASESDM